MLLPTSFHSPSLVAAESTRQGGHSKSVYASRNLGLFTGDKPDIVERNLVDHCTELGIDRNRLVWAKQVHGDRVHQATEPGLVEGVDALITDREDLYLAIGTADCCPVLIWDPEHRAVGAVHAGWRGAVVQILPKTLRMMDETFGTDPTACQVYLGTCIGVDHYEIGEEVAAQFPPMFLRPGRSEEKAQLDLMGCLLAQTLAAGVSLEQVSRSEYETYGDPARFYSYRRDGETGRMLAIIGRRARLISG